MFANLRGVFTSTFCENGLRDSMAVDRQTRTRDKLLRGPEPLYTRLSRLQDTFARARATPIFG